jgi:TonB-linked SusC/RagA family outer membrane protein
MPLSPRQGRKEAFVYPLQHIKTKHFKSMKKELQVRGHVLFIMKVSLVHFFATLLFISVAQAHESAAQVLDTKISLELNEVTLRKTLERLEEATHAKFLYQSNLIASRERISLHVTDERLADVLERILAPRHIAYEAEGNQIILTRSSFNVIPVGALPEKVMGPTGAVTVTGVVMDDTGGALPGVNVLLKGTTTGTTTDSEGKYALTVPDETAVLIFSFIGFTQQEVAVGTRTQLNITLQPDITSLSEIVVVGYGEVKKSDLTGAVSSVKSEDLNALPNINAVQGLTGRAAGVQVIQTSGAPGAAMSIRVRGGNSMNASNEPLYVIDGFPISGSPVNLNPVDIESTEVLKDASATAIYGSRGANGVVMITTKRGKSGASQVTLDSYVGVQEVIKTIDMLNARQFATLANERASNDKRAPFFTEEEVASFGEGTDWQDAIFRSAPIQNHTVTFSGGNDKSTYSISGSMFDQQGIIIGSDYTRGSLRANINQKLSDKFSVNYNTILSRSIGNTLSNDNASRGDGVVSAALTAPPTVPVYKDDGTYSDVRPYSFSSNAAENPVALAKERLNKQTRNSILTNLGVSYELIKGLTLRVSAGVDYAATRTDYYSSRKLRASPSGNASTTFDERLNFLNENILTYTRDINDWQKVTFTGGFTYQTDRYTNNVMRASGFPNDELGNNNLGSGTVIGAPTSSVTEWTLVSWLGRVNYAIRDRYLFTASVRADGSSRFGTANKWAVFPSGAFAWRASEEDFIKNLNVFSNLKARVSWGETGNTGINPYQTLNNLQSSTIVLNNDLYTGYAPGSFRPNPDLKWETTTQTDIGVDMGFFKERITFSADYYIKRTTDLLATVPLPPATGFVQETRNIGEISNKGIELVLGATVLEGDFNWNVSANFAANRNKVESLAGGSDVFGPQLSIPMAVSINLVRPGYPMGVFYGYREEGLDENGNIKYVDTPAGTTPNPNNRSVIGDPNPDFIYGFNNNFSFKNFTLNVFFQGVYGNELFNFNLANHGDAFNFGENQVTGILDRWTPENNNVNAAYPRISGSTQFQASDRYVEDGSFLRLKNIRLGYSLPVANLNLSWLKSAQVYVSAQNLLTITDYSWYDPEVSTRSNPNGASGMSGFALGIDQTSYPVARSFTAGISLGF